MHASDVSGRSIVTECPFAVYHAMPRLPLIRAPCGGTGQLYRWEDCFLMLLQTPPPKPGNSMASDNEGTQESARRPHPRTLQAFFKH